MGGSSLPPGFRFHPTDEELVGYYLHRKVHGLEIELEVIPVVELYKFDPWELPEKSFLPKRDMEWFFFCPRDRKYPNGTRTNRATNAGYWKATGKDRKVVCQSSVTGYRKTLVFYRGRAPLGDRTDWVMHEYRLCDDFTQGTQNLQGAYALCRVIKKNEAQKIGNSHGAKKADLSSQTSNHDSGSWFSSPAASPPFQAATADVERNARGKNIWVSPELILDSSKDCPQPLPSPSPSLSLSQSSYFPHFEYEGSVDPWDAQNLGGLSPGSSYSNFAGEGGTGGGDTTYGNFMGFGSGQYMPF